MKVALVGVGNMGISWAGAALLAGHDVVLVDRDRAKLDAFYDGQLVKGEEVLWNAINRANVLATDKLSAVSEAQIVFVAVQTPAVHGEFSAVQCDLNPLLSLLKSLVPIAKPDQILLLGSTIFPGMIENRIAPLLTDCAATFAYQPVFLRAGSGVTDYLHPSKIVIGVPDPLNPPPALDEFIDSTTWNDAECNYCTYGEAEFIKLMHNSFMCVKINFANEFGDLCDIQGVDPIKVVELTFDESSDGRLLTTSHMRAGPPFSGTCLPKDSAILHGMLKQRLILHRCPTLASAYGFNRDRIVRTFKVAADGVQSVGVIGMGYRPGYLDARHSLAIEFAKVASREGKQVKFWDRQFSKMDRDEYHLAARRDLEVEAIHRRLVGTIEEVLECDSLIVNAPLEPHEFDKVAAFAEAGRRVVDLYRNGLGHA